MTDDRARELLPCPFCGEAGEIHCDGNVWYVACSDCHGSSTQTSDGREAVIECWNSRAPDTAQRVIEAALKFQDALGRHVFSHAINDDNSGCCEQLDVAARTLCEKIAAHDAAMKPKNEVVYEKCPTCGGSGLELSSYTGEPTECHECKGNTVVESLEGEP